MLQRFDQQLQEVRSLYDSLQEGERKQFRVWLQRLSDADAEKVPSLPMSLIVHTNAVIHDDGDEVVYEGHAEIAPRILLKAVDAWSHGAGCCRSVSGRPVAGSSSFGLLR